MFETIKNKIIFKFIQGNSAGTFDNTTEWGLIVKDAVQDVGKSRWGEVTHIGPSVKDVQVGDYILIEPMMWSLNLKIDGDTFWNTDESKVMAVTKEEPKRIF